MLTKKSVQITVLPTDTDAVIDWLKSLKESEFRDKVLRDLFKALKSEGSIASYANIHGRNDKGVDYVIIEDGVFGRRIIGIQVKSIDVTRTGGGKNYSALDLKTECQAALQHEFLVEGNKYRLDLIEVWNSRHTTEDAESELSAPGTQNKFPLRKPDHIARLLEKYCPDWLKNIPQYSLVTYIRSKQNPQNKAFKLLGTHLNPKTHFLEPEFSIGTDSALDQIKNDKGTLKKNDPTRNLDYLIERNEHSFIHGTELCGKSYLLEHLESRLADRNLIPVLLLARELEKHSASEILDLAYKKAGGLSRSAFIKRIKNVQLIVLIDDYHLLAEETRKSLVAHPITEIRIIGAGRSSCKTTSEQRFSIAGVKLESVSRLLRTLEKSTSSKHSPALVDRAVGYLQRVFGTSGLPRNPFTVAICLHECQHSSGRFSTPTFGRLIERFVEAQAGSHSDDDNVDFETKTEILKRLAGKPGYEFPSDVFHRLVRKHIGARALPHLAESVKRDLIQSGLFSEGVNGKSIRWAHPVFKDYYWVRNLVEKRKLEPLLQALQKDTNITVAALIGSQLRAADHVIIELTEKLTDVKIEAIAFKDELLAASAEEVLPNDEEEQNLLTRIEQAEDETLAIKSPQPETEIAGAQTKKSDSDLESLSAEKKELIEKHYHLFSKQFYDHQFHIAYNLGSLVLNARSSKASAKETAVRAILNSNAKFGRLLASTLEQIFGDDWKKVSNSKWLCLFFELQLTDKMIGDPYLEPTFKSLLKRKLNDDELLMLLDLMICCGSGEHKRLIEKLKEIKRLEVSLAIYMRIVALYFYRYHKPDERKTLRHLLGEIRLIHKGLVLPKIV